MLVYLRVCFFCCTFAGKIEKEIAISEIAITNLYTYDILCLLEQRSQDFLIATRQLKRYAIAHCGLSMQDM